eukprot:gene6620-9087_t
MGKLIGPPLTSNDRKWIEAQHVFFHGSAALNENHRVNISPKSSKQFRIIDENLICWLDYSGSGCETAAHILENKRLTIMFVAFEGPPKIMRFFGKGEIILAESILNENSCDEKYSFLRELYPTYLRGGSDYNSGFRAIILLHIDRITQSCGYSIPKFDYVCERKTLDEFASSKGDSGMKEYRGYKNSFSIDGLPSIGLLEMKSFPTEKRKIEEKPKKRGRLKKYTPEEAKKTKSAKTMENNKRKKMKSLKRNPAKQ